MQCKRGNERMKHIEYVPHGVCSNKISFDIDDQRRIHNLTFKGGCNGNLKAIAKILENYDALEAADLLKGNECGIRDTSCVDQLAKAIKENI
jgi:uncharacterized protein (TIGR03905 family)